MEFLQQRTDAVVIVDDQQVPLGRGRVRLGVHIAAFVL